MSFILELNQTEEWGIDEEISDDYWNAAQIPLSTALALVQQGVEFLVKSKIACVSPFFLIASNPSEWPRQSNRQDVPFADFRTLDAQDLIKVHDTVAASRFSDAFKERYDRLRRTRNSIIHTVDKSRRVDAYDVMLEILEVSEHLIGPRQWIGLRREHISSDPGSVAYSTDGIGSQLAREIMQAIELLPTALANRFFDFNKRQRRYICPNCLLNLQDGDDLQPNLAQLRPNQATSKNIYCALCFGNYEVVRNRCTNEYCLGNVIDPECYRCLSCGYESD